MKKLVFTLFILSAVVGLFSCEKDEIENNIYLSRIIGVWKTSYEYNGLNVVEYLYFQDNGIYTYATEQTFNGVTAGKVEKSSWTISNLRLLYCQGEVFKIEKLTTDELVISRYVDLPGFEPDIEYTFQRSTYEELEPLIAKYKLK